MAAQNSQGIQTLLEAEKEASKVVQKARAYRVQKLKDARSEAAKELEEIKARKAAEFAQFEKDHTGSTAESQAAVNKDTELKLAALVKSFGENQDTVVAKLLERVVLVKAELHRNVTKVEA